MVCGPVSALVWTCQAVAVWPLACCTIAPLTPPSMTAFCTWLSDVVDEAGNVKTAPPLKSTLKSSPRTSSATMLIDQDQPGDRVPQALPADEVDRYLAAVKPAADLAEPRHHELPGGFGTPCCASRRSGRRLTGLRRDRGPPRRLGAEPGRIEAGQRVAVAEELGPGQQRHHRLGEQEHHDDVDERGQAEGVGEALDLADGEVVQQHRGEERHRVGDQDRAPGALPAAPPPPAAAACPRAPRRAIARSRRRTSPR